MAHDEQAHRHFRFRMLGGKWSSLVGVMPREAAEFDRYFDWCAVNGRTPHAAEVAA